MAATGFTPILLYASGTATNVPSASNLTNSTNGAELAINYADGKLFYKDGSGNVQTIASKAAASGTFSSVTITGGTINGTTIGATTASTGAFTTLSATGVITSTVATGTAPFTVSSTTPVANLSIGGNAATATSATSATTATTATNVASGAANQIVYNTGSGATSFITAPTTSSTYLQWNGTSFVWATAGGGTSVTVSNDTATSTNLYPLFATATSGTVSSVNTSNAKLLYKPSTGEFQASEVVATNGITVNANTVASDYTIASGFNGGSVGPVTVNSGVTVTVASGSVWNII